jgi:hypothetical protein
MADYPSILVGLYQYSPKTKDNFALVKEKSWEHAPNTKLYNSYLLKLISVIQFWI